MVSAFPLRRAHMIALLLCAMIVTQLPIRAWAEETPSVSLTLSESIGVDAAIPAASAAVRPPAATVAAAHPAAACVPSSRPGGLRPILRI
jgi:hypothetical protein